MRLRLGRTIVKLSSRGLPALGILMVVALAASVLGQGVPSQAPVGEDPPAIRGVGKWHNVPKDAEWADRDAVRFDRLEGRVAIIEFGTTWSHANSGLVEYSVPDQ